jgi:hypothetical protein
MVKLVFKSGDAVLGEMEFPTKEDAIAHMTREGQSQDDYDEKAGVWRYRGYTMEIIEER